GRDWRSWWQRWWNDWPRDRNPQVRSARMADVVVDIGNSRMKWGRVDGGGVAASVSLPLDDPAAWEKQRTEWRLRGPAPWRAAASGGDAGRVAAAPRGHAARPGAGGRAAAGRRAARAGQGRHRPPAGRGGSQCAARTESESVRARSRAGRRGHGYHGGPDQ